MTPRQREIMAALRLGEKIGRCGVGYVFRHRRMRSETIIALAATGELSQLVVLGLHGRWEFLCHQSRVADVARDRTVIQLVETFSLKEREKRDEDDRKTGVAIRSEPNQN